MATYLLAYTGGGMPATDAEREASMAEWGAFLGGFGDALVDGGNPIGASKTVAPSGAVSDGSPSRLSGYSIITASSLDDAAGRAKGCPILSSGGNVEVHEIFPVM
jgi:hypothetical protein